MMRAAFHQGNFIMGQSMLIQREVVWPDLINLPHLAQYDGLCTSEGHGYGQDFLFEAGLSLKVRISDLSRAVMGCPQCSQS